MTHELSHRGPDDAGIWRSENSLVGLGHRRLAIIDLTQRGHQPMIHEDRSCVVSYNGEIYNFRELRRALEAQAQQFRSSSDTEVLLNGYRAWNRGVLDHLQGMFAFVIWDDARNRLLAARDRIGIKPLYYYWDGEMAILASEIRAILMHPNVSRVVDRDALRDFLTYGYVPEPKSIFSNILKVRPGEFLEFQSGKLEARQYWDLGHQVDRDRSEEEWITEIRRALDSCVESHLVSDVSIGGFLSGGVDSSAIVETIARRSPGPRAFAIGFSEEEFNELPYARLLCQRQGIELSEHVVTPRALDEDLDTLAEIFDEPIGDQSALPTNYLCEVTRAEVKVAVSGDGGDENFGGYHSYGLALRHGSSPRPLLGMLLRPYGVPFVWWNPFGEDMRSYVSRTWPRLGKKFTRDETVAPAEAYMRRIGHWTPEETKRILRYHEPEYDPFWAYNRASGASNSALDQVLRIGLRVVLPGRMLAKVDRTSMAHGLEVRVPLLDHRFIEMAASIPAELKLRDGETKYIFKKALRGFLPEEILTRPKHGFTPPIRTWFADRTVHFGIVDSIRHNSFFAEFFCRKQLNQFLHASERHRLDKRLWDLVVLDRWSRKWL